jgi:hypothetical protein
MIPSKQFALTTDLAAQLVEQPSPEAAPHSDIPPLREVLPAFAPLPPAALFLGVAGDGLPVLLNLADPVPGPVLILGDPASGKTRLLSVMAGAAQQAVGPESIQIAVITTQTGRWRALQTSAKCAGIFSPQDTETAQYLGQLAAWTHENKGQNEFVLLLIDGLADLVAAHAADQDLRWLLLRGPARRVWPIATLAAERAAEVSAWLEAFRTRVYGYAEDGHLAELAGDPQYRFEELGRGSQFVLREGAEWMPFWTPTLE